MKSKRYNLSLIEIIIATSLFGILIFSTTSLFFNYNKLKVRIEKIRPIILNQTLFYTKILEMTNTINYSSINKIKSPHSQAFTFSFDNGYKDNHKFSGKCQCHLFRNFAKEIIYEISNDNSETLSRCLLTNIDKFTHSIKNNILYISLTTTNSKILSYAFFLPQTSQKDSKK